MRSIQGDPEAGVITSGSWAGSALRAADALVGDAEHRGGVEELDDWRRALPDDTTVISAADTVRSIAEIVDLLSTSCPSWRFRKLAEGGHMAVLTRPELMIPHLVQALS